MSQKQLRERLATIIVVLHIVFSYIFLLNYTVFTAYANYATFINAALIALAIILSGKIQFRTLIYVIISLVYMIVAVSINSGGVGSILTYCVSIMTLDLIVFLNPLGQRDKFFHRLCILLIVIIFIDSIKYTSNFNYYEHNDVNPNTLGMFVLFAFCIFICTTEKRNILLNAIALFISLATIINLESRGILIAFISFCILSMLPAKAYGKKFIFILIAVVIAVGIAFPFIYLNLYRSGYQLIFLNKSLYTGREGLWIRALDYFSADKIKWIFGIGSRVELWDAATNVHNSYFGIIVNFGIAGLIIYFLYLSKYISKVVGYAKFDNTIKNWLCMFISVDLVLGFTETSIFWSVIFVFANLGLGRAYNLSLQYEEED